EPCKNRHGYELDRVALLCRFLFVVFHCFPYRPIHRPIIYSWRLVANFNNMNAIYYSMSLETTASSAKKDTKSLRVTIPEVIVPNTGDTTPAYSDSGLLPNTNYTYRVSAINIVGAGNPSNTASAIIKVIDTSQSSLHKELEKENNELRKRLEEESKEIQEER